MKLLRPRPLLDHTPFKDASYGSLTVVLRWTVHPTALPTCPPHRTPAGEGRFFATRLSVVMETQLVAAFLRASCCISSAAANTLDQSLCDSSDGCHGGGHGCALPTTATLGSAPGVDLVVD